MHLKKEAEEQAERISCPEPWRAHPHLALLSRAVLALWGLWGWERTAGLTVVVWLILTENYRVKENQDVVHGTNSVFSYVHMCSIAQLCPALWDPITHQAPLSMRFSCRNTGVSCHFLLQGVFPTRGLNPHLLHSHIGNRILYH